MMTPPGAENTALAGGAGITDAQAVRPAPRPAEPSSPKSPKSKNIHVSPAVLDAARKDSEELLRALRTSPGGLTQADADERALTTGPNEVAQEERQGWPVRLLKIIRN